MSLSRSHKLRPPAKLPCTAGVPIGQPTLAIRQHGITPIHRQGHVVYDVLITKWCRCLSLISSAIIIIGSGGLLSAGRWPL